MNFLKFVPVAQAMASMSKDPSRKIGCVAVNDDGVILSAGFNGFPRGVADLEERYLDKSIKYKLVSHAEQNLVAQAAYAGHSLKSSTVILSGLYPCSSCAKSLIQAGVKTVLSPLPEVGTNWGEEAEWSKLMFEESGVLVIHY